MKVLDDQITRKEGKKHIPCMNQNISPEGWVWSVHHHSRRQKKVKWTAEIRQRDTDTSLNTYWMNYEQ